MLLAVLHLVCLASHQGVHASLILPLCHHERVPLPVIQIDQALAAADVLASQAQMCLSLPWVQKAPLDTHLILVITMTPDLVLFLRVMVACFHLQVAHPNACVFLFPTVLMTGLSRKESSCSANASVTVTAT